jgi:hypothetical protein
MKTSSDRMVKC